MLVLCVVCEGQEKRERIVCGLVAGHAAHAHTSHRPTSKVVSSGEAWMDQSIDRFDRGWSTSPPRGNRTDTSINRVLLDCLQL